MSSGDDSSDEGGFISNSINFLKFFGSCLSLWGLGYMRLSPTWIAVGTLGYYLLQVARRKRVRLTGSLKAIGENEKQFILKNFSVRDLPSWVYFPDVERAEWFNKIVKRLWPYVSDYARSIIMDNVTPAVNEQLSSALKPFSFLTIDLGDTPPRVGGVKVYMDESIKRDEIVMDLDVMLYSDARIKVQLGKIKAGVKEFELRGTLRVILKPLVPRVPFSGAVTVCFLDSPYINFSLTDMGNLLGLPGLQQTLNTVIRNVVNDMIVLPNRLPVQLLDDVNVNRLRYPLPQGLIRVNVIAARRLKVGDKNAITGGSSDPYCVIRVGARTFKTQIKQKTLNPEWNEFFETVVDVSDGQFLSIEVFDKDQGNKDDVLGSAAIPLESVHDLGEVDTWVKLEGVSTGSVHLNMRWFNFSDQRTDLNEAAAQALHYQTLALHPMSSGYLYVVVEEAKNLMRLKQMREPSPYCNLLLGREAQVTEVKERTQSPYWEAVHQFLITNPNVDVLQIIIRDSRTETLLGKCNIPIRLLLAEPHMTIDRPFQLEEAGPEGALLFLHLEYKALLPGIKTEATTLNKTSTANHVDSTVPRDIPTDSTKPTAGQGLEADIVLRNRSVEGPTIPPADLASPQFVQVDPSMQPLQNIPKSGEDSVPSCPDQSSSGNETNEAESSPLGRVHLTVEYSSLASNLSVIVHEAINLVGVDKDGLSDPYIKLLLIDEHGSVKAEDKTEHLKDTLNPVYEKGFDFTVTVDELPSLILRVDVKNHVGRFSTSGRTRQMGSAFFDLRKLITETAISGWYSLAPLDSLLRPN